jgi:hypothetical protein
MGNLRGAADGDGSGIRRADSAFGAKVNRTLARVSSHLVTTGPSMTGTAA